MANQFPGGFPNVQRLAQLAGGNQYGGQPVNPFAGGIPQAPHFAGGMPAAGAAPFNFTGARPQPFALAPSVAGSTALRANPMFLTPQQIESNLRPGTMHVAPPTPIAAAPTFNPALFRTPGQMGTNLTPGNTLPQQAAIAPAPSSAAGFRPPPIPTPLPAPAVAPAPAAAAPALNPAFMSRPMMPTPFTQPAATGSPTSLAAFRR